MKLNLTFLENTHLIGKLKLIELLEKASPYRVLKETVERRFSRALGAIPDEHREAALAIFGSTIYLPQQMLEEAWKHLWLVCQLRHESLRDIHKNVLVLELDRDQIRDEFYRCNSIVGRLQDNLPWRSTHDIIDALERFETKTNTNQDYFDEFISILRRPYWLLLVDITLSGTSVLSEIRRIEKLRRILLPREKYIGVTILAQVATETAVERFRQAGVCFEAAIIVPRRNAIRYCLGQKATDHKLMQSIVDVCDWFAEEYVLRCDNRISIMAKEDREVARYGFGAEGWNVVTYKNCPNNCLPLLWLWQPGKEYIPPFERVDSRDEGGTWPGRRNWLDEIASDEVRQSNLRNNLGLPI